MTTDDYTLEEMQIVSRAETLLKRKNNKYRPIPKFKGGCKNC